MTPAVAALRMTGAAHRAELPLLVLGPAVGTSALGLWTEVAAGLTDLFDVVALDLPGQGYNRSVPEEPFSTAELAAGVLAVVTDIQVQRDDGDPFAYAGVALGADVGVHLLLEDPPCVSSMLLLGTADAVDGEPSLRDRLDEVGAAAEVVGTSDLSPTQRPDEVALLVRRHVLGHDGADRTGIPSVWGRPGLDARSRAVGSLAALTVVGRHDELAEHLRAAVDAGLLAHAEIHEVVQQAAAHCSASDADAAYRAVRQVLRDQG